MADFNEIYAKVKAGKYTFAESKTADTEQETSASRFDKIHADVKAGKYTFAGGVSPLHEDHLGAYRAKKAEAKPTILSGALAAIGSTESKFVEAAGRHQMPVAPVKDGAVHQLGIKNAKQTQQQVDIAKGTSAETRLYDKVIGQIEPDLNRYSELQMFYDDYQINPDSFAGRAGVAEALEEFKQLNEKYGSFADAYETVEILKAEREKIVQQNHMKNDLAVFATWDKEDQDSLYRGLQAYADNEMVLVGYIERELYDKYGKDAVKRIWESVAQKQGQEKLEAAAKAGQESPDLGNTLFSIPVGWMGSILTIPYRIAQTVDGGTGRYGANAYAPFSEMGEWARNVQAATTEEVGNWVRAHTNGSEQAKDLTEGIAEFAFGAGVQIVDNLGKAAAFGVGSLALAATAGFEEGYRQAADSGATGAAALALGVAKGALEVLTEKIPLDNLLDNVKAGKSGVQAVIDALAQGGIEATTEELNFLGGLVAEAAILRDKSGYQQMVKQAMAQGMNYAQAREYATQQLYLMAAETAATAFVAGAGSSGITSIATNMDPSNAIAQQAQDRQKGETAESQAVGNGQNAYASDAKNNESRRLTEADIDDYMRVGDRLHVRNNKQRILDDGDSPILTKPEEIVAFIRDAFQRKIQKTVKGYGRVNNRLASAVKAASNGEISIDDYYLELDADEIAHISDHVVQDKDIRNIPLSEKQLEQLPEYIDTYDDLINIIHRKDGSVRLMLGKKINGHTIIVETVSKGRQSLHPVTAYQIDSADYMKYYKTRAIDRSSTSRPADTGTVDISRQAIAPADISIRESEPVVNSADGGQQEERVLTFQEEAARQLGIQQTEQQPEEKLSYAQKIRRAENNNNGGNTNEAARTQYAAAQPGAGNGVSDGGSQRAAGMGTGEQAGSVAGRTGQTAQRSVPKNAGAAGFDRQNRAQRLRKQGLIQPVSSKSLGLNKGTDAQNLLVLPESEYDAELREVSQRIKAETGKDVTFVVGAIQIRTPAGNQKVRGARTPDGIIVQADNLKATATQIADHEAYHDKIRAPGGLGLGWSVRNHITENCSEEEFQQIVGLYADAMAGTMEIQNAEDQERFLRRVEEEVLADAYAGIDYRGYGATKFTGAVNEAMDQKGAGKLQRQDNGVRQTNAPPSGQNENTVGDDGEWYSLDDVAIPTREELENKQPVAVVDISQAQTKGTFAQRRKQILENAPQVISKPYLNKDTGVMIFLTEHSYTHAFNNIGEIQLNAAEHIPEFIENAVLTHAEGNTHGSDYATGVYTFFAAAKAERVRPVKLKVKEYRYSGQELPRNIKAYFENHPQGYAASYDTVVLEVEEIEESPAGSAKDMNPMDPFQGPAELSKISVADLLNLVKGDAEKYIPKPATEVYSYDDSDYDRLDAELESESQRWRTTWLKDQLGEEGYEQYRESRALRDAEQKAEQRQKDREQRKVETNRRKLQRESRESTIDAAMNKKLQDGAKPTEAKKELRRSILDMFSIPAGSRTEAVQIIDGYADRIIKNGVLTEADRKAFFDRMYAAGVMTVPADEYMALGRDAIRKGKIYVNESLRQELGDDWAELRRRAFGAGVYLTTDQQDAGVDVWNDDLAGILPGLFDSEMTDQRQILERIVQVAEEGRDEKVSLAEYTAQLAGAYYVSEDEVLDGMERDLDTALRIFAKTAGIEIKVKEQAIRNQTALTKENMRQRLQAAQERQDRKEMSQRQQEQKQLKEMQQKTLKTLQWLSKNRNRAPEELKAAFDEVLSDIDIYAVGAANEMRWSDKYNATWKDLAQMYVQAKETDPNFLPSKELEIIVSRLNDRKIEDLDISALNDLYKAAVGLRTEFYNRNNVMGDEMNRLFEEVYADSKAEIQRAPGSYTGSKADRLFNMEQLTPMNVLQRMGGWDPNGTFYSMARQLENGERDVRAFTVKANRMLEEFLTEHEEWVKKADGQGKDAIWYTIEVPELMKLGMGDKPIFGDTVTVHMTPAQKVHMYLESKNVDNLRHMTGGRTFADKKLYSEGKRQEAFAQGKTIRLAPETVKQIVSNLTAEELELAQILDKFYNGFAKGEINRISNILYGYDKAMGKNYAPIFTNQNYVQSEIGIFDQTAEGVSNLKERQTAKNPSYNIGAFDAFERSVDQTARFVGMAIPARNWNSLLNWREMDNSMGDVITHKWGAETKKYIENLLTELQGGKADPKEVVSETAEKLLSNYISSVFGFNPGIVLKQLGSIPLASAYLGSTNVPSVQQIRSIDRTLIAKYTQDLDWRSMGYSMPETKQLKDNPNWTQTNKVARFAIGGGAITAMDTWAASTLWPWAENKVHKEHPELEIGTQAQIDAGESPFYKKVAEEFERAVSRSQSVSDAMHQSTLRKSKGIIAKALTMFRSDSAQTYNTIRQKIGEAQYYIRSGADQKVIQDAKKAVGTTFLAALGNFLLAGLIDFLMNLWKRKGKNYRDEEGELTFQSVAEKTGVGILQSFAGIVVGGEELAELIGTALTGERWYGVESTQVSAVLDLLETAWDTLAGVREIVTEGADVVKNGGDLGEYLHRNGNSILGSIKDTAKEMAAYLGGVPAGNIEAYMIGLLKHLIPGFDAAYEDAFASADKSGLAGLEGQDIAVRIGNILSNRRASTSGETAEVLAELYEAGYEGAAPSDTPTSVTIDGEQIKLSTYQQQMFDKAWSGIIGSMLDEVVASDDFREADPERQEKMLKTLFTYATDQAKHELFEELDPSSRADDIAAFESVGLGMPEFLRCYAEYTAINAEDLKAKEKAVRFSRWVHEQGFTKQQINVITDNLAYFNMTPADAGKFESAVDSGLDIEDAYDLQEQMAELEPEEGKVQVSDAQRWRLCVDMSSEPYVQIAALRSYMSDAQIRKAEIACHFDIDLSDYVRLYEIRAEYDANGNKSYSQAEYKAAIDSLKLSKEHSGILWQLATGAKSAKNNPYSTEAGERVLKVLE